MTQPGPFTEDLFNNPERPQTSAYVANNLISRALGKVSNDVHQKVKMDYHQKVTALQDRKRRQQQIFEELQQQEDFYEGKYYYFVLYTCICLSMSRVCNSTPGASPGFGRGGAKIFFFQISEFACREATCCAWRSHAHC